MKVYVCKLDRRNNRKVCESSPENELTQIFAVKVAYIAKP